jgi:hypothetical protein
MNKILVAMAFVPASLFAVDGVTLINQAIVTAAGGFPYQITQPGSYKLSGNLSVPMNGTAIQIAVSKVTIDLNGFSITTPDQPSFVLSFGIQYTGVATPDGIIIRGGAIDGFSIPISLSSTTFIYCQRCSFSDLIIRSPIPGLTWQLGNWTRFENVTAYNVIVDVICPSVVVNTVAPAILVRFFTPDLNPPNVGTCTFANNATTN